MARNDREALAWWRQPLVHFLLAGAAIFMLDALRGAPEVPGGQRIVVTSKHVERLADQWQRSWGRSPDDTELQSLVRNYVKEEIFYRESLKLGLDINDPVIRQRLGRKMEFLLSTELAPEDVDDKTLRDFFEDRLKHYTLGAVYTFEQVYFKHPTGLIDDVDSPSILEQEANLRLAQSKQRLLSGASPTEFGDPIGLPPSMNGATQADIARTFGAEFLAELETVTDSDWVGPVSSGFGRHLVRITAKTAARSPTLEEVRHQVTNDWLAEQNARLKQEAFDELRATYDISIELSAD